MVVRIFLKTLFIWPIVWIRLAMSGSKFCLVSEIQGWFFSIKHFKFEICRLIRNYKNIEFLCTLHPAFPIDNILYNHRTLSKPEKWHRHNIINYIHALFRFHQILHAFIYLGFLSEILSHEIPLPSGYKNKNLPSPEISSLVLPFYSQSHQECSVLTKF